MDLRYLPPWMDDSQGPRLARHLKIALDKVLWFDLDVISAHPDGFPDDGLPPNRDIIGRIKTPEKTVDILMQRVPRGDGVSIWKFSNQTVCRMAGSVFPVAAARTDGPFLYRFVHEPAHHLSKKNLLGSIMILLDNHEGMDPEFPPRAYFNEYNPYSLNIVVLYLYHPADYWGYMKFSQWVNLQIAREFQKEGIKFAFPTTTTYLAPDGQNPLLVSLTEGSQEPVQTL